MSDTKIPAGKISNPKDLLLNVVAGIGELRNAVKLEEDAEILKKFLKYDWEEVEDNIDDVYWVLALLANGNGAVFEEVIEKIVKKNKKQLPVKNAKPGQQGGKRKKK